MKAQVLFVDACPHHHTAVERVREAAGLAGVGLLIEEYLVTDAVDAQRLRFGGSPSILVEGRDLFPAAQLGDLACRLYPSPDGRLAGAPTVAQIVEAVRQRLDSAPPE